ncbi:MAG: hypothetical protein LUO89_14410 [Methanothrix sp.]|nr:hypothetical protein [Methanothrix sp.]
MERLVSMAVATGGLPIRSEGSKSSLKLAFECYPERVINLSKDVAGIIWLSGESADAPVLIDLLDLCIREGGGITEWQQPDRRLPLPLTVDYIASEFARMRAVAMRVTLVLAAMALLALSLVVAVIWLLVR